MEESELIEKLEYETNYLIKDEDMIKIVINSPALLAYLKEKHGLIEKSRIVKIIDKRVENETGKVRLVALDIIKDVEAI